MRRYASIDFLRGLAIVMMIVLHVFMFVLDRDMYLNQIDNIGVINVIALILIVTAGGMAGFFLLVSAIGNAISMERNYQAGKNPGDVAIKQIVGGALLLVFAVLTEGVIGYQAFLGNLFLGSTDTSSILWRGLHMETIHTIAWCMIINGIVQWILARKDGWKQTRHNIRVYVYLAIIVLAATTLVWYLVSLIVPGYPYAPNPASPIGNEIAYPVPGVTPWWGWIEDFLLAPLAKDVEPIFPYLATSFIGSIIGILMTQDREEVPRDFPRKGMQIGFTMFVIGLVGLLVNFGIMFVNPAPYGGVSGILSTLVQLYDHRWYSNIGLPSGTTLHVAFEGAWVFQYLFLNGLAICMSLLVIRLVEFRGQGARFAKKTFSIRRYGFVAFSMYNYQFLYYIPWVFVSFLWQRFFPAMGVVMPYVGLRGNLDWLGTFVVMGMAFVMFEGMLTLWERVDFAGGLEWCIGLLATPLIPVKKQDVLTGKEKRKWWQILNARGALHDVEWLNIVEEDEIPHEQLIDSKLARTLAIVGFVFFPLSFVALSIARESFHTEQVNTFNRAAKALAIAGIVFAIAWITFACIVSLQMLGLGGIL
jgi:uncharacterized membrane protein